MAFREKIISFRMLPDLHLKATRPKNISRKDSLKNNSKKTGIMWSNGLLCYGYKPAVSRLNLRVEHGKGKWKHSKRISKIIKDLKIASYRITFCHFFLMIHIAEQLIYRKILDDCQ